MSIQFYIEICTLSFAVLCGIYRFKISDRGTRILWIFLAMSLCIELLSHYLIKNVSFDNIYHLVEFFVISLYFNTVIDIFSKKNVGIYIGIAGIIAGILNIIFLEPINTFGSNFYLFEGIVIICMALFALYRLLLKRENIRFTTYPHFWFITLLLFYYTSTYLLTYMYYDFIRVNADDKVSIVLSAIEVINNICNLSFGVIFLLYSKMLKKNEL